MPDEFRRFLIASFHFYTKKKIRGTNADGNEKTDYISYQAAPLCIGLNYSPGLCSDCLCASQTYNGTNEETVKHTWTADGGEKVSFDSSSVNNKPTEDEQIYISLLLFLFFLVQLSRRAIMGGSLMYQQDGVVLRAVLSGDDELIRSSRAAVSKQQQLSLNSSSLMNISLERKDDDEDIR